MHTYFAFAFSPYSPNPYIIAMQTTEINRSLLTKQAPLYCFVGGIRRDSETLNPKLAPMMIFCTLGRSDRLKK